MIKKIIILLLILLLGGMTTLSCAYQHNNSVFKRDSFLKLEKTLNVIACSEKEQKCTPVNKWGSTASGAIIKNRFDGSYALTAAHVCDDSQMKKFIDNYFKQNYPDLKIQYELEFKATAIDGKEYAAKIVAKKMISALCG